VKVLVSWINPILRGWGAYFRGGTASGLSDEDAWLRRRLRALLRKRENRPSGLVEGARFQPLLPDQIGFFESDELNETIG